MKNPYDKDKEKDQYLIFKTLTENISLWVESNYPTLVKDIDERFSKIDSVHNTILSTFKSQRDVLEKIKEQHSNYILAKIDEFLKNTYPDISNVLTISAGEIKDIVKKHSLKEEAMSRKLETVIKSDTLYEDVYKLRDEFKEIKKFYEGFSKKIKKAFDV